MSSEGAGDAPTRDEEQPEPTTFTLNVVSPSAGVSGPLVFPHLLASTTVQQLKARIRDALPTRPTDESQRLIHRGRMLGREAETMTEIFGSDTLANPESQTLHLVLRPSTSDGPPAQPQVQLPNPPPPSLSHVPPPPPQLPPNPRFAAATLQHPLPGFQHIQHQAHMHNNSNVQAVMNARLHQLQQEAERIHQRLTNLDQVANNLQGQAAGLEHNHGGNLPQPALASLFGNPQMGQRPGGVGLPSFQNLIAQHQRERAAEGLHGASSHASSSPQPGVGRSTPDSHRPDHSTTYTREGVGPNGERWQVTVNETTITTPLVQTNRLMQGTPEAHPALDIQRTLRGADRAQREQSRAARRQASNISETDSVPLASEEPVAPMIESQHVRTDSPAGTEPLPMPFVPTATFAANEAASSPLVEPMVYILSSPSGPRALLVNNSETFYTPRQAVRNESHRGLRVTDGGPQPNPVDVLRNRNRPGRRAMPHNPEPEPHIHLHAGNPRAGALAAQMWPHVWLIVRLLGFIWFFTAGNNSWQRTFMICGLALVVFIVNTGVMNGIAEQVLGPLRRHIDRLLPLAGPDAALVPAANAAIPQARRDDVQTQGNGPGTQLDASQVAARLLEQRRQGSWIMAQVRRAEHALLLFLASLVPGVGERHIAAREAEANAAEQRRIEAANAAQAPPAGNSEDTTENSPNEDANEGVGAGQEPPAPAPPLVEV
ncbi:hypothetical protein BP6252_07850 [Coleophoma cylindrospora]|uniref:Ubiquitin-like domain-containing protein n=1 Tax=Coleophoma cylindrospora TaxID=1849047 RepID=A0A3D8RB60_9HELO|nr:hypothetical protein BP6252_07850 [Coleophoma cylindrospora]